MPLTPSWLVWLALGTQAGSEPPRTVERAFSSELELLTQSFEIIAGDEGHTVTQEGPRYLREQADEIEIVDSLPDTGAAAEPLESFTRLYRSVTSSARMGTESAPRERTASAGLESKTVLFERGDDGRWAKSSTDPGTRPVQLRNLRAELDLAAFLPGAGSEARAPGDTWTVPAATFARLVSPLEEGWRRPRTAPREEAGALSVAPAALTEPIGALLAAAEGEFDFTWIEPRADEDFPGSELALHARFEFELTSAYDGSARLLGGQVDSEREAEDDVRLTYAGDGTLAWDPDSGAFELACQGELRLSEDFRVAIEANGKPGQMRGKLALAGTLALTAREERGE